MDPVTQVLAQQHSGSAGGAGFGQFYLAGKENALQKQRLNLSSRQLQVQEAQEQRLQRRDDMLLPLEQREMAANLAILGQNAVVGQQKLEIAAQSNAAFAEILNLESYFMNSPQGFRDAAGIEKYRELYGRFPFAFAEGSPGHKIRQFIRAPLMFDAELNQTLEAEKRLRGTSVQSLNLKTGQVTLSGNDPLEQQRINIAQGNLQARLNELQLSAERLENQMAPEQREKLRAGLRAIANDPLIIDSNEKLKRMDDFINKFQGQGGAGAPIAPFKKPVTDPADPLGLFAQ